MELGGYRGCGAGAGQCRGSVSAILMLLPKGGDEKPCDEVTSARTVKADLIVDGLPHPTCEPDQLGRVQKKKRPTAPV